MGSEGGKEEGEEGNCMLKSAAVTRGNKEERAMCAETRQCCLPCIESR